MWIAAGLTSQAMTRRPRLAAATAVVPEPQKASRTRSPGVRRGFDDPAQEALVLLRRVAGLLIGETLDLDRIQGVPAPQRKLGLVRVPHVVDRHAGALGRGAVAARIALGVRDVVLVERELLRILRIEEDQIVVADPVFGFGLESRHPPDPPDDFALERGLAKHLVAQQLDGVAHGRVDMDVEAAARGQQGVDAP